MEVLGIYPKFEEATAFFDGFAEREELSPLSRSLEKITYDEFVLVIKKYKNKFAIIREWE